MSKNKTEQAPAANKIICPNCGKEMQMSVKLVYNEKWLATLACPGTDCAAPEFCGIAKTKALAEAEALAAFNMQKGAENGQA